MESQSSEIFYSGGYFLIRANHPGWEPLESELIPPQLISLSDCICPKLNVGWGWIPGNPQRALEFGIPQIKLEAFTNWCRTEYTQSMDMWSMFYTPDDARAFIKRFDLDRETLHIIGTALPQAIEQTDWQAINDDAYGIEKRIEQHLSVEPDGALIGFEVVSFGYGNYEHSWLCHHLHEDAHQLFGIRPNDYGLLPTFEAAMTLLKWIQADGDGGRAHHPPYDVWALRTYPLNTNSPS